MARKMKIPAKIKTYWCWGCRSFIIIDYKAGKYFCARKQDDIHPSQESHCRLRNFMPFDDEEFDEPPEQDPLPL